MFNQCVGRTLDRTGDAAGAQQSPHQRRLPAAEFTVEGHEHPALKRRREGRAGARGGLDVRQMERQR